MVKQFIQSKPSIPRSDKHFYLLNNLLRKSESGLTLTELLVGTLISSIVIGVGFFGASINRKLYLEDRFRNNVNQNLRTVLDIIGADIRQAGENFQNDPLFPVMEISQPSGSDSEIVIRRNLFGTTLPVCRTINAGSADNEVFVVDNASGLANCNAVDNDSDGWPDNLKEWVDYRENEGGTVRAFIYDGNGNGEFFDYNVEETLDASDNLVTPGGGTPVESGFLRGNTNWQNTYTANGNSRIYLLEERRYRLNNNTFELVINGNETVSITNNIDTFQVTATVRQEQGGSPVDFTCSVVIPPNTTTCDTALPSTYAWSQIRGIEVDVRALLDNSQASRVKCDDPDNPQTCSGLNLTQTFVPRNIFNFSQ